MGNTPGDIVAEQVKAYNARDVDGFVSWYADDIVITEQASGRIVTSGVSELKKLYSNVVNRTADLHCEIICRILLGRFVIDREVITGIPGGRAIHAVAIYEIDEGRIRKVWVLKE
jgi:hypothetical protein